MFKIVNTAMKQKGKEEYESPVCRMTHVSLESGICAASKQKVVIDDNNTTVDIVRQNEGGSFELNNWDN